MLCALLMSAAVPALAAEGAAGNCAVTAGIVADAVMLRTDGAAEADAVGALETSGLGVRFVPTVQPLVEWVYTLPEEQLADKPSAAFEAACLEQAG
jgi:hypothetical protein